MSAPGPSRRPAYQKRRAAFRALALLLPVALLALTEIGLRLAGAGYETSFFLRTRVDGKEALIDNARFGWRFFPPLIARTPEPVVLPARKAPGTIRIFVFGESAAMGDPEPSVGLPRMLQTMLEMQFPQQKFEVVNVAMTAINSHVIREIAQDCAGLEGDFWIVYAGNNEVVGPFGGGTVFGPQVPPLSWIRFTLWLKTTRLGQLISGLNTSRNAEWEGMEMFLKQQVRHDDPRLARVYAHFRANLAEIVNLGARSGAQVIVSTVGVNVHDCPPFASLHRRQLSAGELAKWSEHWTNAIAAERAGRAGAALSLFAQAEQAVGGDSSHAELRFHIARAAESLGRVEDARREYNRAKEYDTLRFRADDAINGIIRETSRSPARLVDAAQHFALQSPRGLPGETLFYEHVHFNFEGNYALARLFFDDIAAQIASSTRGAARPEAPSREACAARLCWNEWKQREVYEDLRQRLQQPPFSHQLGADARDVAWAERIATLSRSLTTDRLEHIAHDYEAVLRTHASDWVLHEEFAKFLQDTGDHTNALGEWRAVTALITHDAMAWFYRGTTAEALGLPAEATASFREAIRQDPNMVEARSALGMALASNGSVENGKRELLRAIQIRPRYTQARVNLGLLLAREGRNAEAREQYEAALRIDPNYAEAHLNLGKLLATGGDKAAAARHYRDALRSNPRSAVAHFNLGNALSETSPSEAVEHYRAAITLDPAFAEAHFSLAAELAKANQTTAALPHFTEFVRLRPDSSEGRFNYGVALARSRRFTEAAEQFRETLRLDPANAQARQFLERAVAAGAR